MMSLPPVSGAAASGAAASGAASVGGVGGKGVVCAQAVDCAAMLSAINAQLVRNPILVICSSPQIS